MTREDMKTAEARQIAERMELARRLAGFTQEDAAHELGVTGRTYARWERGETQGFLSELERIAEVFGTTTDQLLGTDGSSSDDRLAALETELRELRELLLDPARLKAAADALAASEENNAE